MNTPSSFFTRVSALYSKVDYDLVRFGGYLRCEQCREEAPLDDPNRYVVEGWPIHCGQTMRWWTQRQVDAGQVPPPRGPRE